MFSIISYKGVLTRPFCIKEVKKAIDMRDEAPGELRYLFKDVESIAFRRRKHDQDAMLVELKRKIED
jgi:hypothetical protein